MSVIRSFLVRLLPVFLILLLTLPAPGTAWAHGIGGCSNPLGCGGQKTHSSPNSGGGNLSDIKVTCLSPSSCTLQGHTGNFLTTTVSVSATVPLTVMQGAPAWGTWNYYCQGAILGCLSHNQMDLSSSVSGANVASYSRPLIYVNFGDGYSGKLKSCGVWLVPWHNVCFQSGSPTSGLTGSVDIFLEFPIPTAHTGTDNIIFTTSYWAPTLTSFGGTRETVWVHLKTQVEPNPQVCQPGQLCGGCHAWTAPGTTLQYTTCPKPDGWSIGPPDYYITLTH